MLRLKDILRLLAVAGPLSAAAFAATGPGEDFHSLLEKITRSNTDPFSMSSSTVVVTGTADAMTALSAIGSATFGPNESGCVMLNGSPWQTGESRRLNATDSRSSVTFLKLLPAESSKAARAVFLVNREEVIIDLSRVTPQAIAGTSAARNAGWLVGPKLAVLIGSVPEGQIRVNTPLGEVTATKVDEAPAQGFSVIELAETGGPGIARSDIIPAQVNIIPCEGAPVSAPSSVLSSAPPTHFVGALVLDEHGRMLGILGARGFTSSKAMASLPQGQPVGTTLPLVTFVGSLRN